MKIKDIMIAVIVIGAALLLTPQFKTGAPHDTRTDSVTTPRKPYPCESDRSAQCTWEQYRQIAEEDCAKYRAHGEKCKIVTNDDQPPRAVRIPSDSEQADMRRKIEESASRLCDNFANAGYECHDSSN